MSLRCPPISLRRRADEPDSKLRSPLPQTGEGTGLAYGSNMHGCAVANDCTFVLFGDQGNLLSLNAQAIAPA